jgi:hypothetical protein
MTLRSNAGKYYLFYYTQLNKYHIIYMRHLIFWAKSHTNMFWGQFLQHSLFVENKCCVQTTPKNEHLAVVTGLGKCPIREFVSDLLNY